MDVYVTMQMTKQDIWQFSVSLHKCTMLELTDPFYMWRDGHARLSRAMSNFLIEIIQESWIKIVILAKKLSFNIFVVS